MSLKTRLQKCNKPALGLLVISIFILSLYIPVFYFSQTSNNSLTNNYLENLTNYLPNLLANPSQTYNAKTVGYPSGWQPGDGTIPVIEENSLRYYTFNDNWQYQYVNGKIQAQINHTLNFQLFWNYCKPHIIVGSTADALTDYPIRIVVHYGSGTDSGENVYCNYRCRTDFGDIRFTKSDGTTQLNYWMEDKFDGDNATFWVKIDSIPASPDTVNIYIYYGKSDAQTTSNPYITFTYFQDFEGDTLPSDWSERINEMPGGGWNVSDSQLKIWSDTTNGNWRHIVIQYGTPIGKNMSIVSKVTYIRQYSGCGGKVVSINWNNDDYSADPYINRDWDISEEIITGGIWDNSGEAFATIRDSTYQGGYSWSSPRYQDGDIIEIARTPSKALLYWNHNLYRTINDNSVPNDDNLYLSYSVDCGYTATTASEIRVDWVVVRSYVDPEPTHGFWGSETAGNTPGHLMENRLLVGYKAGWNVISISNGTLVPCQGLIDSNYYWIQPYAGTVTITFDVNQTCTYNGINVVTGNEPFAVFGDTQTLIRSGNTFRFTPSQQYVNVTDTLDSHVKADNQTPTEWTDTDKSCGFENGFTYIEKPSNLSNSDSNYYNQSLSSSDWKVVYLKGYIDPADYMNLADWQCYQIDLNYIGHAKATVFPSNAGFQCFCTAYWDPGTWNTIDSAIPMGTSDISRGCTFSNGDYNGRVGLGVRAYKLLGEKIEMWSDQLNGTCYYESRYSSLQYKCAPFNTNDETLLIIKYQTSHNEPWILYLTQGSNMTAKAIQLDGATAGNTTVINIQDGNTYDGFYLQSSNWNHWIEFDYILTGHHIQVNSLNTGGTPNIQSWAGKSTRDLGTSNNTLYVMGTIREMDGYYNPSSKLTCTLELWKMGEGAPLYSAYVSGSFLKSINSLSSPLINGSHYTVVIKPHWENPQYPDITLNFHVYPLTLDSQSPIGVIEKIGETYYTYNEPWQYQYVDGKIRIQINHTLSNINNNLSYSMLGWTYCKSHTISGSSAGALTDYQMRILVHYGSGTDSGENVYCNNNCRADFGDIRFTKSDGTLLDYWMESKTDGNNATFWVEVDSIPAYPGTTNIYVCYGNANASTTSNGQNTFVLFDDFNTLDTTIWNTTNLRNSTYDGWTIENGNLVFYSGTRGKYVVWFGGNSITTNNYYDLTNQIFEIDTNMTMGGTPYPYYPAYTNASDSGLGISTSGNAQQRIYGRNGADNDWLKYTDPVTYIVLWNQTTSWSGAATGYYVLGLRLNGNETDLYQNQILENNYTDNLTPGPVQLSIIMSIGAYGGWTGWGEMSTNWARIRNLANPEPTQGTWGSEEPITGVYLLIGHRAGWNLNSTSSGTIVPCQDPSKSNYYWIQSPTGTVTITFDVDQTYAYNGINVVTGNEPLTVLFGDNQTLTRTGNTFRFTPTQQYFTVTDTLDSYIKVDNQTPPGWTDTDKSCGFEDGFTWIGKLYNLSTSDSNYLRESVTSGGWGEIYLKGYINPADYMNLAYWQCYQIDLNYVGHATASGSYTTNSNGFQWFYSGYWAPGTWYNGSNITMTSTDQTRGKVFTGDGADYNGNVSLGVRAYTKGTGSAAAQIEMLSNQLTGTCYYETRYSSLYYHSAPFNTNNEPYLIVRYRTSPNYNPQNWNLYLTSNDNQTAKTIPSSYLPNSNDWTTIVIPINDGNTYDGFYLQSSDWNQWIEFDYIQTGHHIEVNSLNTNGKPNLYLSTSLSNPIYLSGTVRELDGYSNPVSNLNCTLELWQTNVTGNTLVYSAYVSRSFTKLIYNLPNGNYTVIIRPHWDTNYPNYQGVERSFSLSPLILANDSTNPTVTITSPASGYIINHYGDVWINGTYNGTGSSVLKLTINDTRFGLVEPSGGPPYGASGNFSFKATGILAGKFGVVVTAVDEAGNKGTADRQVVVVDTEKPLITITSTKNVFLKNDTIFINGTYSGTGSQIRSITVSDPRFTLVEPGYPYGLYGTFSIKNIKPIEMDKDTAYKSIYLFIVVEDYAGNGILELVMLVAVNPDYVNFTTIDDAQRVVTYIQSSFEAQAEDGNGDNTNVKIWLSCIVLSWRNDYQNLAQTYLGIEIGISALITVATLGLSLVYEAAVAGIHVFHVFEIFILEPSITALAAGLGHGSAWEKWAYCVEISKIEDPVLKVIAAQQWFYSMAEEYNLNCLSPIGAYLNYVNAIGFSDSVTWFWLSVIWDPALASLFFPPNTGGGGSPNSPPPSIDWLALLIAIIFGSRVPILYPI